MASVRSAARTWMLRIDMLASSQASGKTTRSSYSASSHLTTCKRDRRRTARKLSMVRWRITASCSICHCSLECRGKDLFKRLNEVVEIMRVGEGNELAVLDFVLKLFSR